MLCRRNGRVNRLSFACTWSVISRDAEVVHLVKASRTGRFSKNWAQHRKTAARCFGGNGCRCAVRSALAQLRRGCWKRDATNARSHSKAGYVGENVVLAL